MSAEYWIYDSRLGRRWELDPLTYEWQSPYATFNNNPIYFNDPLGLQAEGTGDTKTPVSNPKEGDTHTTSDGTVLVYKEGGWTFPDAEASTTGGQTTSSGAGPCNPKTASMPNREGLKLIVNSPKSKMPSSSEIRKAVDQGMKNAMGSNMMLGLGRENPRDYNANPYLQAAFAKGQIAGDAISIMMATGEVEGGKAMAASCLIASPTGVGLIGVGFGAAVATHGVSVITVATINSANTTLILSSISYHDNNEEAGNSHNDQSNFEKMGKQKGSKSEKMPDDVAKKLGIKNKYKWKEYLHQSKKKSGRGGADNYTWDELIKLGKEYIKKTGNK